MRVRSPLKEADLFQTVLPKMPQFLLQLRIALAVLLATPCAVQAEIEFGSLELFSSDSETSPVPRGLVPGAVLTAYQGRFIGQGTSVFPIPGAIYLGKDFMYLGDRARYYVYRDDRLAVFAYGRVRFGNLDPEKTPELQGMIKRKWEFEAGVGGNLITPFGLFTARLASDVTGTSKGQEGLLWVDFPLVIDRFLVMPGAGVLWRSSKLSNYYFGGVSAAESTPTRPVYDTGSTLAKSLGLITTYRFNRNWIGTASVAYEHYDQAIANSPIVQRKGELFGIVGVGYQW